MSSSCVIYQPVKLELSFDSEKIIMRPSNHRHTQAMCMTILVLFTMGSPSDTTEESTIDMINNDVMAGRTRVELIGVRVGIGTAVARCVSLTAILYVL